MPEPLSDEQIGVCECGRNVWHDGRWWSVAGMTRSPLEPYPAGAKFCLACGRRLELKHAETPAGP